MVIGDFLAPTAALIDFRPSDKTRLLRDLSLQVGSATGLDSRVIADELLKREALGSTGIGGGVAIPHARVAGIAKPYGLIARLAKPIEFDSIDEQPVDVVFLLLLPLTMEAEHLNALACVARTLREPEILHGVRSARNSSELHRAVTMPPRRHTPD